MAGSTWPSSTCPPRCARASPTSSYVEEAAAALARHLRPGCHRGPRVDQLPGHHRGAGGAHPRGRLRPGRRRGLPPRLQPRAHRSGQPDLAPREHAQGGLRASTRPRWRPCGASTTGLVERTVPVSGTREAELTKLLENTFRHVNIALVNELAMFAADLDIDVWEAIDAASTKPFGYLRFTPGPGVGGHCLPIDPSYLSWKVRRSLGPAVPVRRAGQRRQRAHARLRGASPDAGPQPHGPGRSTARGSCSLGLAYKRNTGDAREAPGHGHRPVAGRARRRGAGRRSPPARRQRLPYPLVELTADELDAADAVVIVTDHDAFDYDLVRDARPLRARHPQPPGRTHRRAAVDRRGAPTACGAVEPPMDRPVRPALGPSRRR